MVGERNEPYFERATSEALTAIDNSIGSSGGTTEVTIRTQSRRSLDFFIPFSTPEEMKEKSGLVEARDRDASRGRRETKWETRLTVDPDVGTGSNREAEKESDEDEGLEVSSGDGFGGEDHRPDELTLSCTETSSEDDGEASSIGS